VLWSTRAGFPALARDGRPAGARDGGDPAQPVRLLVGRQRVAKNGYPDLLGCAGPAAGEPPLALRHIGGGTAAAAIEGKAAALGRADRSNCACRAQTSCLAAYAPPTCSCWPPIAEDGRPRTAPNLLLRRRASVLACLATQLAAILVADRA